ncbi:hypothetical protein D3C72_1801090 [compost metagenome]
MNRYFGMVAPEAQVPMVATRDIAARAAFLLMNPDFDGQNVEYILGERNVSHLEAVKAIGKAIGKEDLEYVETPEKEMKEHLIAAGLSEDWADSMIEMSHAGSNGSLTSTVSRDRANTTPTSIEEFARTTFLEAYNSAIEKERARLGRDSSSAEASP